MVSRQIARASLAGADGGAGEGVEDALGHLGDDHDLVVLRQDIQEQGYGQKRPREQETLHALIGERRRELRAAALDIGPRLYEEKPAEFCDRLAATGGFGAAKKSEPSSS